MKSTKRSAIGRDTRRLAMLVKSSHDVPVWYEEQVLFRTMIQRNW